MGMNTPRTNSEQQKTGLQSAVYEGTVQHRRHQPIPHAFQQSLFLMWLELAELPAVFQRHWFWSVDRTNLASFWRRDHFGDPARSLDESVRTLVEEQSGRRPNGPIRVLTHLRYFGYCFNPLSVYCCFDADGTQLEAVVAEVSNTPWNERHCYVLPVTQQDGSAYTFRFPKGFHVSPFMDMDIEYRWTLRLSADRLVLHTENLRNGDPFFDATLTLRRREITGGTLAGVLLRYPWMTAQVIAGIYWQALRLWLKSVTYYTHPLHSQVETKTL